MGDSPTGSSLTVMQEDGQNSIPRFVQRLNDGFGGVQGLANATDIEVVQTAAAEFVYVTSPGSIAIFERDPSNGSLTFLQIVSGLSGLESPTASAADFNQVFVASDGGFGNDEGGIAQFTVAVTDAGDFEPEVIDINFSNIGELTINTGSEIDLKG